LALFGNVKQSYVFKNGRSCQGKVITIAFKNTVTVPCKHFSISQIVHCAVCTVIRGKPDGTCMIRNYIFSSILCLMIIIAHNLVHISNACRLRAVYSAVHINGGGIVFTKPCGVYKLDCPFNGSYSRIVGCTVVFVAAAYAYIKFVCRITVCICRCRNNLC